MTAQRTGSASWLALGALLAAIAWSRGAPAAPPLLLESLPEIASGAPENGRQAAPIGAPELIVVPDIGVRAPVRPVGLLADGALATPPATETGWYERGALPGTRGSAVIVGHVDSRDAPGVFAALVTLRPGALIGVRDQHGVWTVFRAHDITRHPKSALPRAIWGSSNERLLRLITCGGAFDRRSGHYRDNVVAHAEALGRWRPPAAHPGAEPPWTRIRGVR